MLAWLRNNAALAFASSATLETKMPRPSKLLTMPPKLLQDLHERLVQANFSNYAELSSWLQRLGVKGCSSTAIRTYATGNRSMIEAQVAAKRSPTPRRATMTISIEVPLEHATEVVESVRAWSEAWKEVSAR